MLPFMGRIHVAYLPGTRVIGLSKIPRLIDIFARRLQIQERLTAQIADCIEFLIEPVGVCVVSEARHFCMMMRGVEKQHSDAAVNCWRGVFKKDENLRREVLSMIERGRSPL
jgi:GTP cyclohydrolase I